MFLFPNNFSLRTAELLVRANFLPHLSNAFQTYSLIISYHLSINSDRLGPQTVRALQSKFRKIDFTQIVPNKSSILRLSDPILTPTTFFLPGLSLEIFSVFNRLKSYHYETPDALKDAILIPEELLQPDGDDFRTQNVELSADDRECASSENFLPPCHVTLSSFWNSTLIQCVVEKSWFLIRNILLS
jgi:hypothetical protein